MKIKKVKKYKESFGRFLFLLPALLFVVFLTLYPLLFALFNSFRKYKLTQLSDVKFIGFNNYIKILTDRVFLEALVRTISLAAILVILELIIGLFIAIILSKSFRGHGLVRSILVLPIAATPVIVGLTMRLIFDTRIGVANYLLSLINITGPSWLFDKYWSLVAIIIMDVWQWTPFLVIILLAGILSQPKELNEAAIVDGANTFQVATKVTIPLLKKVMGVGILIRVTDTLNLFDQVWVLTKGGPGTATETTTIHIYKTGFSFFDFGKANAMSFIMLIIMMVFVLVIVKKIDLLGEE
jgi:multiple sugar transport system permease protein